MRTIAHISDLHFGRVNKLIPSALRDALIAARPDIVVVSGDLTQRARTREFRAARMFLDSLPFRKLVVPGNHDVPLYDVRARWLSPLTKYRSLINDDLDPFYCDAEIAVQGINTARSLTFKNGRINRLQIERTCQRLGEAGADVTRVVVTHHPFDAPGLDGNTGLVGRAKLAVSSFAKCQVDMILSGHLHVGHTGDWARRYPAQGYSALLIQAGTATSSRYRDESNSWNLIRIEHPTVKVERHVWNADTQAFAISLAQDFVRGPEGWTASMRDGKSELM